MNLRRRSEPKRESNFVLRLGQIVLLCQHMREQLMRRSIRGIHTDSEAQLLDRRRRLLQIEPGSPQAVMRVPLFGRNRTAASNSRPRIFVERIRSRSFGMPPAETRTTFSVPTAILDRNKGRGASRPLSSKPPKRR